MSTTNGQLESFLYYYCDLPSSPTYAIMVKGPWGCGKTYLIKNFMNKWQSSDKKYLYVSLYGLTSTKQIHEALFQSMHPLLASKAVSIGGRILKGTLKAALKIDLDGDGKDDGTVSLQLPDVSLVEDISTNGYLLVFDDLERCSISIADVMGYINGFVEHAGQKCIIIANENDIETKDKELGSRYAKIKEKLVGKTFEVVPDEGSALSHFVKETKNQKTISFFNRNEKYIIDLYRESKNSNLRILRQFILDFDRLLNVLDDKFVHNDDFLKHLFGLYMCFTFEHKNGNLAISEFDLIMRRFISLRTEDSAGAKRRSDILGRYSSVDFFQMILPTELWAELVDRSYINFDKISEFIGHSKYFYNPDVEDWRKLWNYIYLEQEEFETARDAVREKVEKREYVYEPIILHVIGIFISLSDAALIEISKDDIKFLFTKYIDDVFSSCRFLDWDNDLPEHFRNGFGGLGIQSWDDDAFVEIRKHLSKLKRNFETSKYPTIAGELINLLHNDIELFTTRICYTNSKENLYANVPVFTSVKPEEFAAAVLSAKPAQQIKAMIALKARYDRGGLLNDLAPEKDWIIKVRSALRDLSQSDPLAKTRTDIMCKNCLDHI